MATNLDLFAYLAAFVSVILALAVSDWVQSLHRLIRARKKVRWSIVAFLSAFLVFNAILEEFFSLWRLTGVERFTYVDLLVLIFPPIMLSLAAMAVFPDDIPASGIDLVEHYMDNRCLVYLLLSLWVVGEILKVMDFHEVITGRSASIGEVASVFPWQTIPVLMLFALMAWSKNMRLQLAGLVVALIMVTGSLIQRSLGVVHAS